MFQKVMLPFLIMSFAGCSTYQLPANIPTANLYLEAPDLEGSGLMANRSLGITVLESEKCALSKYGAGAAGELRWGNAKGLVTKTVVIPANEDFHFFAWYGDANIGGWGLQRGCTIDVSFQPQLGHSYKGVVSFKGNIHWCNIAIYDVTSSKEEFMMSYMPPTLCPVLRVKPDTPNGIVESTQVVVQTVSPTY